MTLIRKATLNDLNGLAPLFDQYRIFYEKSSDLVGAFEFLKQRLTQNESVIFIAFSENENIIGFVQLYPIFSSTRMKRLWLLNDLFVDFNYRQRGFSKSLINKAKEFCIQTGACGLTLETAKSNIAGNKLYPEAGFTLDIAHNYYWWNGE